MGCWNGTCAITNLPIFYRDPVRVVLIQEGRTRSGNIAGGFSYPTGMWTPLGAPLRGFYDDYGRAEGVEYGFNESILRGRFFDKIIPAKTNHGEAIGPTSDWESVLNWIERGVVSYKYANRTVAVGQALIHEDVYQELLRFEYEHWYTQKTINAATLRSEAYAYLKRAAVQVEEDKADPRHAHTRAFERGEAPDLPTFDASLYHSYEGELSLRCYDLFIRSQLAEGVQADDPRLVKLVEDLADFFHVCALMGRSRKFWSPQSGAGSQSDEMDIHVHIAGIVTKHVERVQEQRRREESA